MCVCVCVYTVYACLLVKLWPQQGDIKLCPSSLSPPITILPPPDSHPPIWSHRGPLVPETPCSRPVLMSPGLANSFNHLLIPKASQADLKAPQKPFSPAIVAKSYSCCASDAPSFTAQIQALHYLQKLCISSRSFINGLTCFQGREARKTISLLITVKMGNLFQDFSRP